MSIEQRTRVGLSYDHCRYGTSKMTFRGPYRMPQAIDVAVLGGTETFGKYVPRPFPMLLELECGRPVANLGAPNAGVDSFLHDPAVEEVAQRARVAVVQIMGAHALSNAFYRVHRRRNDRFIAPSRALQRLYPEVDFSGCTFVRHMLGELHRICRDRFVLIEEELRQCWLAAMANLIDRLAMPTVLLWVSDRHPAPRDDCHFDPHATDPLLVSSDMIEVIGKRAIDCIEAIRPASGETDLRAMVFPPLERQAAAVLPGPLAHAEIANRLAGPIRSILEPASGPPRRRT